MLLRIYGAILIMLGCGAIGLFTANYTKFEISTMKQYIAALEYMICDLRFRQTPLTELFRRTSDICTGVLNKLFNQVAINLESQRYSSAVSCLQETTCNTSEIPRLTRLGLEQLARSLGLFDLQGQLDSLEAAKAESEQQLARYSQNQDLRLRYYKTLGICAGAAIVILLI